MSSSPLGHIKVGSFNVTALYECFSGAKTTLFRFPAHLREWSFWVIQGLVLPITALHYGSEMLLPEVPFWSLHHIPVILYIIPISFASIKYRWEGGLLTSLWAMALVLPSVVLWHRDNFIWLAEILRIAIITTAGVTLASRVEAEARQRRQAEAVSAKLAISEAKVRAIFEAAGDAILVFDGQGTITEANAASADLLGMPNARSLQGQHIGAFVPLWRRQLPVLAPADNGNARELSRVIVRQLDGKEIPVEAVIAALADGAGDEVFEVVFRDATAQEMREKGLRSLVRQITRAQEEERERIARELHDDTLQTLLLVAREVESTADTVGLPPGTPERLRKISEVATHTGEDLRRFSRDLRPSVLNDLGLVPAIEWLASDLSNRTTLAAGFRTDGEVRRLGPDVELALFRIAQEALRNVERHAYASKVDIVLSFAPSEVRMTIMDDGVGFSAPPNLDELVPAGKLGLVGLKERASLAGGHLEVFSAPGQGTKLSVAILT